MKQFLIALDQLANTLVGGYADETLSARAHRDAHKCDHDQRGELGGRFGSHRRIPESRPAGRAAAESAVCGRARLRVGILKFNPRCAGFYYRERV